MAMNPIPVIPGGRIMPLIDNAIIMTPKTINNMLTDFFIILIVF